MVGAIASVALAFLLASFLSLSGCTVDRPVAMNESLYRSPVQLAALEKQAEAGSGDAAYEICIYYEFYAFDHISGQRWLEKAAALHYRPAVESLENTLIENSSAKDRRRGRSLLIEARKLPEV